MFKWLKYLTGLGWAATVFSFVLKVYKWVK
jgi:hypothetical protein